MCFNISLTTPIEEIKNIYNLDVPEDFKYIGYSKSKVAFTHPFLPVIFEGRRVGLAKWGLIPSWVRECRRSEEVSKFTLNAKIDIIQTDKLYKDSIDNGRIAIFVDGFNLDSGFIGNKSGKPMILAGLFSEWGGVATFSLITKKAQGVFKDNGNGSMPLFLNEDNLDTWLDSSFDYSTVESQIIIE